MNENEQWKENEKLNIIRYGFYKECEQFVDILKQKLFNLETNKEKLKLLELIRTNRLENNASFGFYIKSQNNFEDPWQLDRIDFALYYIDIKIAELKKLEKLEGTAEVPKLEKIQWKGSPALFGYLFTELVDKGYIEPPLYAAEWSYSKLAKLCFQYFDIRNKEGELTKPENLIKAMNPNSNNLSNTKREKFPIPNLSDLA